MMSTLTGDGTKGAELESEGGGLQIKKAYACSLLECSQLRVIYTLARIG